MPKNKLRKKSKSIKHPYLQEMKMKSDVVMSSKRRQKVIDVKRSVNYKYLAYFFSIDLRSYRLDPATSIQEQEYDGYLE